MNLVVKIILCQFDMSKKKRKRDGPNNSNGDNVEDNEPEMTEEDINELVRGLDKEEKEMDDGDDKEGDNEETEKVIRDVDAIEKAMEGEIKEVLLLAKPVRQVLFKVSLFFSRSLYISPLLFFCSLHHSSFFFSIPPFFYYY